MENKQKAIEKAYGFLNDMIDENGWAVYSIDEAGESGIEPFGDYEIKSEKDGVTVWRPKSIQGIETNNGWIKIESEADFDNIPNGNYHWYNIETEQYNDGDIPYHGKYTHYQTIIKPKKPIY